MFDFSKIEIIELYSGIEEEEIIFFAKENNLIIPNVYKELLKLTGYLYANHFVLYGFEAILDQIKALEVYKYMPNYIPIGSDNGGVTFYMKQELNEQEFIAIGDGSRCVEDSYCKPINLIQWLNDGGNLESIFGVDEEEVYVNVIMTKELKNKKDLLKIKKKLKLQYTIGELLKMSTLTPIAIVKKGNRKLYEKLVSELVELKEYFKIEYLYDEY